MSEQNGTTTLTPEIQTMVADSVARAFFASAYGTSHNNERDYYLTLGYPENPNYLSYYNWATRDTLGRRLVRNLPKHTWQYPPTVRDTDDPSAPKTPFMQAWETLVTKHKLWQAFRRVDKQSCIGNYAILFLGLRGARRASMPVERRQRTLDDLLYVRPYSQRYLRVEEFENDTQSERFGLVKKYSLRSATTPTERLNEPLREVTPPGVMIDASRAIHVAEDLIEDDIFGVPKLLGTYPRLIDLMKIAGGSAEMFWRHAKREVTLSARDGFRFDSPEDKQKLETQVEEFTHKMRDFLFVHGIDINSLPPGIQSPLEHFQVQAALIAADWEIPQRLLFGSERGELASSQDIRNYVSVISGRQQDFAQPTILEATIMRLVEFGILPEPAMPLTYDWPDLFSLGEEEEAKIAADWATAIERYDRADTQSGGSIVSREEARSTVFAGLGLPAEEEPMPGEDNLGDEDV